MAKKINFILLKKRKFYQRLDIYPFFIIKSLLIIFIIYSKLKYYLLNLSFVIIILIEIILFSLEFYSINLITKFRYFKVKSIYLATDVKIDIYYKNTNRSKKAIITKILREKNIIKTIIEKSIFIYDEKKSTFIRSKFNELKKLKVGEYLKFECLKEDKISEKRILYGENLIKIPIPSFFTLYKENLFTPFFIFHLICIVLKIFVNYIFYSLISLIMVCIFEIIIVVQRILNLAFLRNMRAPSYYIYVYRDNKWKEIPSNELLPGDIVSVIDGSSVKIIKNEKNDEIKNNLIIQIINKLKENKQKEDQIKNQKSINAVLNKYKEKEKYPVCCDMLLLSGNIIVNESMLTGENVPQMKDSIIKIENLKNSILDCKNKHKNSIIFGGTKIVKSERNEELEPLPQNVNISPPDNGAICLVLKIGFDTSQGKLIKKALYNSEKNKQNNKKLDFLIIGLLLIFAFFACCYVLKEGIHREKVIKKLIIQCLIIITSIVPGDFPIELSLIIYNSLFFFESKKIVCIESYRIPLAGEVDICCFDKTGTLTSDEFIMKETIINTDYDSSEHELALDCNEETFTVLLGCNSLINLDGKPTGDPIDLAMFKQVGGKFIGNEICCQRKIKIIPIKKYIFESNLKRMTVLSKVYNEVDKKEIKRVLCKGAPEIIKTLLKEVPDNYDRCFMKWAKEGFRVLALAFKDNDNFTNNTKREELEKDLIFCGFTIFETPLKKKADKYIAELINSKYDLAIITGEHLLTTVKMSKDLKFGKEKFALLKIEENKIKWKNLDNKFIKETKSKEEVKLLSNEYTLCITGGDYKIIDTIKNFPNIYEIIQYIQLFCRFSQKQKVEIIKNLLKCGKKPLMCGDGSNDVEALKLSTIGIAMLNIKENKIQKKEPFNLLSFDSEATMENWDAASFAPFTSQNDSIKCVKKILVQGRCALVIYNQMYKIFILNSLITTYIESFLYCKGIRLSEYQNVFLGFLVSMLFLMFSKAKPIKSLNPNKPKTNIFSIESIISIISIIGQFIIHLISFTLILYLTKRMEPLFIKKENLESQFVPNLNNTLLFLFQNFNQIIIFIVNYKGEPFMENISENVFMRRLIYVIFGFGFIVIFDVFPQLNEDLELIQLPKDINYKVMLILIMLFNFVFCYILEKWRNIFGYYEPIEKSKNKKEKNT